MSDDYLFKPDSTFLNSLAFGSDAGSSFVDPELRQIIAQNRTLDAVKQLGQLQGAALVGQHVSHDLQRQTNEELHDLSGGMERMGHGIAVGMNDIAANISDGMERHNEVMSEGFNVVGQQIGGLANGMQSGFQGLADVTQQGLGQVSDQVAGLAIGTQVGLLGVAHVTRQGFDQVGQQIDELATGTQELAKVTQQCFGQVGLQVENLSEDVRDGFQQVGQGLRTGFQAVVQGLAQVDERLGQRMLLGFSHVTQQMRQQHEETQATLIDGFNFVSSAISQASDGTISAIAESTEIQVAAQYEIGRTQVRATHAAADQITQAIVDTARLQIEAGQHNTAALLQALHEQSQQLSGLRDYVRRPAANEATEHFLVGMNFLNRLDFGRALAQFQKARERYAGHFPTLFAEGFCWLCLGNHDDAQDSFEAALSQTAGDPERARRQRALASLYMGRLAFDREDYRRAERWFEQSYTDQPEMWNALVEAAASRLLTPDCPDRAADAKAVQRQFNSQHSQRAYLHWYLLALLLARLAPDIAREAFRAGVTGDYRARAQDRVELVALLWRLNSRQVPTLLSLVQDEFPWLR